MSISIYLTEFDKEKLMKIIEESKSVHFNPIPYIKDFEHKLYNAITKKPEQLPADVINLNSKVKVTIDDEEEEFILVYPDDADFRKNKLSVLSPIGAAIFGYKKGDTIEANVPNGKVRIIIKEIA
jgi:regulator of nucleoside diphosphate kinase